MNPHAELVVDLDAIRENVATLRTRVAPARMMSVVKADGYGHGLAPVARAARAGGAEWLGVAFAEEAMALRDAGDTGRILSWLAVPEEDYTRPIAADVDVTASSVEQLAEIGAAARSLGATARVQLKVDTGLSRNGCSPALWPAFVDSAARAEGEGSIRVTGVWSHLACADEPGHPANDAQEQAFRDALKLVDEHGLSPEVRHLANSAGALLRPSARFDLVRCGIATYGLSPAPAITGSAELGLVPAMTAQSRLALVKRIPAGSGVSYGHTWVAGKDTTVALVPVGYGDGVIRLASSRAHVLLAGRRRPIVGRVCMDQFVVDLGDDDAAPGDVAVLFGSGARGEPTAQDWAEACETISYEIVTRIGGRMRREYSDDPAARGRLSRGSAPEGEA
ncbi:MAG TPA: alanine racemase [Nocardioidaceae bacterium]|nr:alanine racemase [Nocardioidaceae bacterium]